MSTASAGPAGRAMAGRPSPCATLPSSPCLKDIERLIGRKVPVVEGHPWPMVVLEAPKRDKNGRIINAEDAEARAAARERSAARRAERAKAAPQPAPSEAKAPAEGGAAPSRRRKKAPAAPAEPAPAQEVQPAQPKRERARGVRPGTKMETGDAMPSVEFTKPDPLAGDRIMDATARLLAPRRTAAPAQTQGSAPSGGKRRSKKTAPETEPAKPASRQKAQPKQSGKGRSKPAQGKPAPAMESRVPPQNPLVKNAAGGAPWSLKSRTPRTPPSSPA